MKYKLFKPSSPLVLKKEGNDRHESPVHLIVHENDNLSALPDQFRNNFVEIRSHYRGFHDLSMNNIDRSNLKFVFVSTAQRCGTWLHKYFFKFYCDAFTNYPLHIGLKLTNPLTCERLKALFFVGHMPFPLENLNQNLVDHFFKNNAQRVFELNPGYFNNHLTSLKLMKDVSKRFGGYEFKKFYYVYRNVFDQFISFFLMSKRSNRINNNVSLFEYTKNFLIEPFAFQFLTFQWAAERFKPGTVKIVNYNDIIKDQKKYFRDLLADFNVPIDEEALSVASYLSSKKFLNHYEITTGLTLNESIDNENRVKHITNTEDKKGMKFKESEKEAIKKDLIDYGLKREYFPEFN